MRRLVPHPLLSLALLFMWLLLNRFSLGHLVLGTAIALVAGWALSAIEPAGPRPRRLLTSARLFGIVFLDIIRSNIAVAKLILTDRRGNGRQPGFVEIPLRLRDPVPLAILSIIVTATPGTAWVEYDPERSSLLLHVLDLVEEDEWRRLIGDRYEALLLEVFA
ncbi:MAG: Na+/H+ antiporter subunit E [Cereibacter sphaeroides]|uniref:Na+/H+ antiporter subunit E n=1 Tax=Cereibacter sphaeroides TaxID=1063 RepID=A0A2W5S7Q4_CERSP|nr:MAG: Na+/H+ antiporter subunit E [Cereibacter sphaeroides]